jgi:hypothetical protein
MFPLLFITESLAPKIAPRKYKLLNKYLLNEGMNSCLLNNYSQREMVRQAKALDYLSVSI